MTTPLEKLDYSAEYKEIQPSLFRESDVLDTLLKSIFNVCDKQQEDLLWISQNLLNIDAAEKSQLDFIGNIVGQPRFLSDFNTEPYFGYDGSYQSKTFGSSTDPEIGGYWNSRSYFNTATSRKLNDDEYRRLIKARVIYNQSNCTANDLLEVINLITNSKNNTVQMLNHGLVQINSDDSTGILSYFVDRLLMMDNILPIAAGVRVGLESVSGDGGTDIEEPWTPIGVEPVKLLAETFDNPLSVTINFDGGMAEVNFGDGSEVLSYTDSVEHTFNDLLSVFEVSVKPLSRIDTLTTDIQELTDWGTAGSISRFGFLHIAPSVPNTIPLWLKDTSYMFHGCRGFSSDISGWNVSNITNMEYMLFQCSSLNSDLNSWDVSKVKNMRYMFSECHGNLGTFENWNVSSVTNMSHMFDSANSASNLNLSLWNVSNVTDMSYMFACIESTHNFNSNLSNWDTSRVTNMSHMFYGCHSLFSENYGSGGSWSLSGWDVSNVTDMQRMFYECYDGVPSNISKWKTGKVTNMKEMFKDCFKMGHLTFWDTSNVTDMSGMFWGSYQFNSDLSNWNVSKVLNMENMFNGCSDLITSLGDWCVPHITSEPVGMFENVNFMPNSNKPVWGTCPRGENLIT